ncbi:MAG: hypothetical protein NTW08_04260 [Gammaproteobacteria bacterium]|nr:hypothetical protein [Gammaproteobacteria bacterium]
MPAKNESLSQKGVETAGAGAQQALTAVLPDGAYRLLHWCFYSELSLTNPAQIEQFNALLQELEPFSGPNAAEHLPRAIAACWRSFSFDKIRESVYQFKSVINLKEMNQQYAQMALVNGQAYRDFPLTLAVLSTLSTAKSLQGDSKQNIAKIVLSYVALVALELSTLATASEQYEAVEHLKKVVDILVQREKYRAFFDKQALDVLKELSSVFQRFLSTPHPIRDAEFIPRAVEKFVLYQVQLVSQLFKALLILTEGGNKPKLTFDYTLIAKGQLNAKHPEITFHPMNPFQELLKYAATFIPDLHVNALRHLKVRALRLPEIDKINTYLEHGIKCGYQIGGARLIHGEDPLLYLLEQKMDASKNVCWSTAADEAVRKEAAHHLFRLADWLRFHLYIADKMVNMKFLLSTEGQRWLASGEARFVQLLINRNYELLKLFQEERHQFRDYLSARIRTKVGLEHNILSLLGQGSDHLVNQLIERGVQPLLNIEERFTQLAPNIDAVRVSFFSDMSHFLNDSGYAFQLPSFNREVRTEPSRQPDCDARPRDLSHPSKGGEPSTRLCSAKLVMDDRSRGDNLLAQQLKRWVTPYLGTPGDGKKRDAFLAFWRPLCFIDRAGLVKMQDYQAQILHETHKILHTKAFYEHIQQQLHSPHLDFVTWATEAMVTLAGSNIAQSYKQSMHWIENEVKSLDASLITLQNRARAFKLKRLNLTASSRLVWSDDVYKKLESFILKLGQGKQQPLIVETTLDLISHQLLQDEKSMLGQYALDAYLTEILSHYAQCVDASERTFCEDILRGLLALGANPLPWMDKQMQVQTNIEAAQGRGYFIAAQEVRLILSHFEYRATYLGDSVVYLKEKLDAVFTTTIAFAERLYGCVEDDASWWWRLAMFFGVRDTGGARLERAEIYWAVLKWIYIILNEELAGPECDTESQAYLEVMAQLETAKQHYLQAAPETHRLYNQGTQSWLALNHALTDLSDELRRLRSERHTYLMAMEGVSQQAQQKIEEHRRALDVATQKASVATKEKEEACRALQAEQKEKEAAHRLTAIERQKREAVERRWYLRELQDTFSIGALFNGQDRDFKVMMERILNRLLEGEPGEHRAEKHREIAEQLHSLIKTNPQFSSLQGYMQRYVQRMVTGMEATQQFVSTQSMFRYTTFSAVQQEVRFRPAKSL